MKKIFVLLIFILNFENLYAENKIAYIDINHILNNSIVGQSITIHIKDIEEKKNTEFKSIEKNLSDKEKDIINKKNILDEIEFNKQVEKLKEEINIYRIKKNEFKEQINKKKMKYTKLVLTTLNPIISKYVENNSITIVFPKKSIIIAKNNLDITNPIMNQLNDQLKKIDF